MPLKDLAGQRPPQSLLDDIPRLVSDYYRLQPDSGEIDHQVRFGTSGHRGSSSKSSFNELHVLAITQAVCDYRLQAGIDGPLFLGMDSHALSEPARTSAVEVFAANDVTVLVDQELGYTPTPAISHAIVAHNRGRRDGLADGVVLTPSHNPPMDGGYKYNPPSGGPADTAITNQIQDRANALMREPAAIRRMTWKRALRSDRLQRHDFITPYITALDQVVDMAVIARSGIRIGADPMGGSGIAYWAPIAEHYGLDLHMVRDTIDPTFRFMTVDHDGKIRMDCSSTAAMAGLIELKDQYDIAFGNDTDFDRHGIVTPSVGLLNPNHFLAVAIDWLCRHRPDWPSAAAIGKTLVSSSMIDRVVLANNKGLCEVPVGFKWFVDGLLNGSMAFGGEESAGAAFLRRNGTTWCTDKDGIILNLLAAEITARSGDDPGIHYQKLTERFGAPVYERIDAPANREQKALLAQLSPEQVAADTLAGDPITDRMTRAPGNDAAIGGLKVSTEYGWFAARPSGTEDIYKIYAESFQGETHLRAIQDEAKAIVSQALAPD